VGCLYPQATVDRLHLGHAACLLVFFAGGLAPLRPLQRLVGHRWSVGLGAFTVGIGLVGSSFAVNVWQFLIGSGAVVGLGCALSLLPPLCLGFYHYPARKGLVGGVVNLGALLGTGVAVLLATTWLRPWFGYAESGHAAGNDDDDDNMGAGVPNCQGAVADDGSEAFQALCWRVPAAMALLGVAVALCGLCGAATLPKSGRKRLARRSGGLLPSRHREALHSAADPMGRSPHYPTATRAASLAPTAPHPPGGSGPGHHGAAWSVRGNGYGGNGHGNEAASASVANSVANSGFDEALSVARFSLGRPSLREEDDRPWSEYDRPSNGSTLDGFLENLNEDYDNDFDHRDGEGEGGGERRGESPTRGARGGAPRPRGRSFTSEGSARPLAGHSASSAAVSSSAAPGQLGRRRIPVGRRLSPAQRPFRRLLAGLAAAGFALSVVPPLLLFFAWNPKALEARSGESGSDPNSGSEEEGQFALSESAAVGQLVLLVALACGGPLWGAAHDAMAPHRPDDATSRGGGAMGGGDSSSSSAAAAPERLSESEARVALPAVALSVCSLACAGAYSAARAARHLAPFFAVHVASASCLGGAVAVWPAVAAELFGTDALLHHLGFLFAAATAAATLMVAATAVAFRGAGAHFLSPPSHDDDVDDGASAVGLSTAEIQAVLIIAVLAVAASVAVAAFIAAAAVAEALAEEEDEEEDAGPGNAAIAAVPDAPSARTNTASAPAFVAGDVRRRPAPSTASEMEHEYGLPPQQQHHKAEYSRL
jgi:hypothetical protein